MPTPCTDCNTIYTSYKGWWNHRKRYHEQAHTQNGYHDVIIPSQNCMITKRNVDCLQCKKCEKYFSNRHSRWRHEQNCKADEICTIEPTTNHIDTANNMNSINNGSYNTINNGTLHNTNITNNITVVLGSENLDEVLTKNEILSVLKKQYGCIEELVSLVHASSLSNKSIIAVYLLGGISSFNSSQKSLILNIRCSKISSNKSALFVAINFDFALSYLYANLSLRLEMYTFLN